MQQYGLVGGDEMIDIVGKHESLMNSETNRAFAEKKIQVESIKQEVSILRQRQNIELEDLRRQQNYYEA